MIFLQFDKDGKESYRHYKPHLLSKELLSKGILVQSIQQPTEDQEDTLMYDGKRLYYRDKIHKEIQELQQDSTLLKEQTVANSERSDFIEDVIAEMAIQFYP